MSCQGGYQAAAQGVGVIYHVIQSGNHGLTHRFRHAKGRNVGGKVQRTGAKLVLKTLDISSVFKH